MKVVLVICLIIVSIIETNALFQIKKIVLLITIAPPSFLPVVTPPPGKPAINVPPTPTPPGNCASGKICVNYMNLNIYHFGL